MCPNHLLCNPEPDIDVSIPPPAHMTTSAGGGQCAQATNGDHCPGTLALPPRTLEMESWDAGTGSPAPVTSAQHTTSP